MFNARDMGIGLGIGGIAGGLFGGSTPNYGPAEGEIGSTTAQGENLLNPFMQGGHAGQGGLENFMHMFGNPSQFYENFSKNYQMSPGAKNQLHTGLQNVRNVMAGQGLTGSGPEASALSKYTQGVINQDMNSQFNNIMRGAGVGMDAAGQLYHGGLGAAESGAGLYGQEGSDIARMMQAQAEAEANQKNSDSSSIMGGVGFLAGAL